MNFTGLVAATAAFLGVWLGHVAVRKIEYTSPTIWLPILVAIISGLGLELGAWISQSQVASAALGILGFTVLWDGLEFARQQRRVAKGHAPANPHNPRHARILASYPAATTLNPLKRDPGGTQGRAKPVISQVEEESG